MIRTALVTILLSLTAAPALAGPPIARVVGTTGIYAIAREAKRIGFLANGTHVELVYCEPVDFPWCEIKGGGWVDGSFLVGGAAKTKVSPGYLITDMQ